MYNDDQTAYRLNDLDTLGLNFNWMKVGVSETVSRNHLIDLLLCAVAPLP